MVSSRGLEKVSTRFLVDFPSVVCPLGIVVFGFIFDALPGLNVYANVSTSFQTPTSTEFANPDGSGGFNPDLEPQSATNYELGLRGHFGDQHHYEAAMFEIDLEDELIPFEVPANPGRNFFANVGRSTRKGLEFSYVGTSLSGLQWTLAYTHSDFVFDEFTDDNGNDFAANKIPGIPDNFFFAELSYERPSGFFSTIDLQHADSLFANNANTETVDGYTVINLRAGFDKVMGSCTLTPFVGINNLFDERYTANVRINAFGGRYFEPAPERNFYAGISVRYRFAR